MNCPHCQRVLYSRQHPKCGFCGGELPAEMRLTAAEVSALKTEQAAIDAGHAAAKEEAEAEERERRKRDQDGGMAAFM